MSVWHFNCAIRLLVFIVNYAPRSINFSLDIRGMCELKFDELAQYFELNDAGKIRNLTWLYEHRDKFTHLEIPISRKKTTILSFERIHISTKVVAPKDCSFGRFEVFRKHNGYSWWNLIRTCKGTIVRNPGESATWYACSHLRLRVCGLRLRMNWVRTLVRIGCGSRSRSAFSRLGTRFPNINKYSKIIKIDSG